MADDRAGRSLRRGLPPEDAGGAGALLPGSLHGVGAGGDGAPLAGGEAARRGTAVPGGGARGRRFDDDGDSGGAVAAPRRGGLPAGAGPRPALAPLKIAVPVKGRLRTPAVELLEHAGFAPDVPGERALAFPCRNAPIEVL